MKRVARYLVWKPNAAIRFRRQELVGQKHSLRGQGLLWLRSLEKEHDGIGGADWCTQSEIWISTSELDSGERGRSRLQHSGEKVSSGLLLRSVHTNLGIQMKDEIQSDISMAHSLTDRLGAGPRTKHIDTRYYRVQEPIKDGHLSIKKVPTAKNGASVGTKPVSASVPQQHCKFAGLVLY